MAKFEPKAGQYCYQCHKKYPNRPALVWIVYQCIEPGHLSKVKEFDYSQINEVREYVRQLNGWNKKQQK